MRLQRIVERVGILDSKREDFPERIRGWAFRWLNEIDGPRRRQGPSGKGRRDADRDEAVSSAKWSNVINNIDNLRQSLEDLPLGTKNFLFAYLASEPNKSIEQIVASWPNGRSPWTLLIYTLDRLRLATPPLKGRGRKRSLLSKAVEDLASIWTDLTGCPPGISYSSARGGYEGAFYDFACDAVLAVWPVRSIDGIVKRVVANYGPKSAKGCDQRPFALRSI